ncbi:MAG TPA: DUF5677 domain-containing protein [Candidatus Elarobacter sp.]|jgi:hypothetical protein|nr:DUF5677 domain-containing protein [Candidatus Elarobacter sp.]
MKASKKSDFEERPMSQTQDLLPLSDIDRVDDAVDAGILATGIAALELLADIRMAIDLRPNNKDRRMAQMCQAFFLGKIHRVSLAMLTLMRHGQGEEATSLLREQYEFIVSLLYYQKHSQAAVLFMASHPLTQLEMAERNVRVSVSAKEKKKRERLIKPLQREVAQARKAYPNLVKPCPANCTKPSGHVHDWNPPATKDMLLNLMGDWLKTTYQNIKHTVSRKDLIAHRDVVTDRLHLVRAHFLSQEKHGLAFALRGNLRINNLRIEPISLQVKKPNDLVYHIIGSLDPIYLDTVVDNGIADFEPRIKDLKNRLASDKARLRITDPNPAITALRDVVQ